MLDYLGEPILDRPDLLPVFAGWGHSTVRDLTVEEPNPIEIQSLPSRATDTRRRDFLIGRAAARRALNVIGPDAPPILSGANREPVWPTGIAGSIAHARGHAVALVAPLSMTDGVGVDVEFMDEVPELWAHVPRSEELDWLNELESKERMAALISLFSAKEALYKAFYPRVGKYFGFEAASARPVEGGFEARLVQPLDSVYPEARTFRINCDWSGQAVVCWLVLPKSIVSSSEP